MKPEKPDISKHALNRFLERHPSDGSALDAIRQAFCESQEISREEAAGLLCRSLDMARDRYFRYGCGLFVLKDLNDGVYLLVTFLALAETQTRSARPNYSNKPDRGYRAKRRKTTQERDRNRGKRREA